MASLSTVGSGQIKVTLPDQLYLYLRSKADKFGLTMSSYVRNLIIDDVKDVDVPVFRMSTKREKIALRATGDYKEGKTRQINDISEYLNSL